MMEILKFKLLHEWKTDARVNGLSYVVREMVIQLASC